MQVTTYIKDLLYRYECVIVPGFGAFLVHSSPASISEDHIFHPPARTVSFNRQLQTNDGLLANHVASCEGCSYESALQKIRYFTRGISKTLDSEQELDLEQIGTFRSDQNDVVSFDPSTHNYDSNSFGLVSYTASVVNREAVIENTSIEESQPVVRSIKDKPAVPYLRYAAVGIIAIALSGLGGVKIYNGQVEKHNFAEREQASKLIEQEIQEATFIVDDPLPAVTVSFPEMSGKYHVIAGAYRIEENAIKKLRELKSKGFPARNMGKNAYGLHQVAYSTHSSRDEALKSLRMARTTDNSDAWLLIADLSNR